MDNIRRIQSIDPKNYRYRYRTLGQEEILQWFDWCDAAWAHDGDPAKPHVELTSGLCSNGYFDCPRVLQYPNIAETLAAELVRRLYNVLFPVMHMDYIIGSAYAAITFSYEAARQWSSVHGFVEKDPADPAGKKMLWRRMTISEGAQILQIEELITTSHTFREVRRAIQEGNPEPVEFLPVVGCLVHRPPKLPADYGDVKVVALVEKEIWAVKPEDCPLCQAGSVKVRPKSHWAELTGKR